MHQLVHEVVICTKDRPDELRRCISALGDQDERPRRILIVDASERIAHRMAVELVDHHRHPPGLTAQRNYALRSLLDGTSVVHFLDDDAVPEPGYLSGINSIFRHHEAVVGVGGCITDLMLGRPLRSERFFGLNSSREGVVLRSGRNVHVRRKSGVMDVQWLPGCAMSFDVEKIVGLEFDERRTGGGLGEDVDFSLRASERGRLLWTGFARTAHIQSDVNRPVTHATVRKDVNHRWMLADDGLGQVRRWAIVYSVMGRAIFEVARACRRRSSEPLRLASAAVAGLWDSLVRGRVGSGL